jgi:hypothetical protein
MLDAAAVRGFFPRAVLYWIGEVERNGRHDFAGHMGDSR